MNFTGVASCAAAICQRSELFESWAYEHRASLADSVRNCLLEQAEHRCLERRFTQAGRFAERAYLLPGADEPAPEVLARLHGLFLALHHAREAEVRSEALRFGVQNLNQTSEEVMAQLAGRLTVTSQDNLPQPLSSFIGRDPELLGLTAMLRNSDVRLVTLQGIGGSGKSQLALEAARQLTSDSIFADGMHLVRLSAVPNHELFPLVLASALELSLQGTAPQIDQITEFIGRKQLLLILDNFEHLMPAAEITTTLLTRCPGLKLLVTSRERLGTQPEVPVTVDGLRFPDSDIDLEQALTYDAVKMFVQRAKMHDRDFNLDHANLQAVLRICRAMYGLPLGLELAALWTEHLKLDEIAAEVERAPASLETQFRDVPDRHKSLLATLDYTWSLLTMDERLALRELTIFRGGFRKDAAGTILELGLPKLAALVHKSLLRLNAYRYELHPLLHEYAREHLELDRARLAQLEERHAGHYLESLAAATH